MLNEASKVGIVEILSSLDDNTVLSLSATVTQGLLRNSISSRQDAEAAILNYSTDAASFLRRKVITKEILFSYINDKNISIQMPATKSDLINRIIELWKQDCSVIFKTTDSGPIAMLALKFTEWFYSMLNQNDSISPEHFFPDVKLVINMNTDGSVITHTVENNPEEVVQRLCLIRKQSNLFFNPNVSGDGLQWRIEPHGLVLVAVCGTLHVQSVCAGVFEQIFGLVRDPEADNNWKIKQSEITLTNKQASNFLALKE